MLDGSSVQIFDAAKAGPVNEAPGTVVDVGENGIVIAAAGGSILAKRVRAGSGGKMAAAEFAHAQGIAPGTRFAVRPT
jgi:methionyl-tRNA formyltransferase